MSKYLLIAIVSGVLSAFSQVLLKKSSLIKRDSVIKEYLNIYVISGYALLFVCMVMMVLAYRGLELKYGAIIESLTYVYALILGKVFFGEEITKNKVIGIAAIVVGVVVFVL